MGPDFESLEGVRRVIEDWLGRARMFRKDEKTERGVRYRIDEQPEYGHIKTRIWTAKHVYAISARPHKVGEQERDEGYLGCVVSLRAARPGEAHTRGADMADGVLNHRTWVRILTDIVSYEAQDVFHPEDRPEPIPVGDGPIEVTGPSLD